MSGASSDTRSDRGSFLADITALSAGHLVAKATGFAAFAALARALSPDGYGAVEYLVGLSVLFATAIEAGLGRVGVRRIAHEPASMPPLTAQITLGRLALAAVGAPLMLLVALPAATAAGSSSLAWLYAASLLALPWRQDWLFQATGRMVPAALVQGLRAAVFAAVVLALVRGPGDLVAVGWAEVAAAAAAGVFGIVVQHAAITPFRLWAPVRGFDELARESALVGLAMIVGAAVQYAPLFLVAALAGGPETAWFGAANRIVGGLLALGYVYFFGLYPALAWRTARDRDALAALLSASYRAVAWGSALTALALVLLAEPLCALAFGPRYAAAAPALQVLAWTLPIGLLSSHARWSLIAAGAQSEGLWGQAAGAVAVAVLGAPLVVLAGGPGAALAAVIAAAVVWVACHRLAVRRGAPVPRTAVAAVPAALAVAAIAAVHALSLSGWAAGLGALAFAAAAPLADRRLWPDVVRLAASRGRAPAVSHPVPAPEQERSIAP